VVLDDQPDSSPTGKSILCPGIVYTDIEDRKCAKAYHAEIGDVQSVTCQQIDVHVHTRICARAQHTFRSYVYFTVDTIKSHISAVSATFLRKTLVAGEKNTTTHLKYLRVIYPNFNLKVMSSWAEILTATQVTCWTICLMCIRHIQVCRDIIRTLRCVYAKM
jgi:hypothetical protein